MTLDHAINMKSFKHHCNCGGFAGMSERAKSEHPHMSWCAQFPEFEERAAVLKANGHRIGDLGKAVKIKQQ